MAEDKVNKIYVDKARLLRRVIIISWGVLALCFVVKIFGGNFFEIVCQNETYKAICDYADRHFWLKYILAFLSSLLSHYLYILSIKQEYKFKTYELVALIVNIAVSPIIKYFAPYVGLAYDFWLFIIFPMALFKFRLNWKKVLSIVIACILSIVFQFLSLIVKNLSIGIIDNSTFISLIYMIDVYIMCFLYYLYRNYQKEKKEMGMFWGWFAGKPVDKLKAMKEKREKQVAKLNEEIKAIETEIERQKNAK